MAEGTRASKPHLGIGGRERSHSRDAPVGIAIRWPVRARLAAELVLDARARLRVNVSEELALEALFYRVQETLG